MDDTRIYGEAQFSQSVPFPQILNSPKPGTREHAQFSTLNTQTRTRRVLAPTRKSLYTNG